MHHFIVIQIISITVLFFLPFYSFNLDLQNNYFTQPLHLRLHASFHKVFRMVITSYLPSCVKSSSSFCLFVMISKLVQRHMKLGDIPSFASLLVYFPPSTWGRGSYCTFLVSDTITEAKSNCNHR